MSKYIYGIVTSSGEHIDVAATESGAKRYATLNGYDTVSRRQFDHYYVEIVAEKIDGKWES